MAARTSGEAAQQSNAYYDMSAQEKPETSIQPEPHGPNHMMAKDGGHLAHKGDGKTDNIMVDVEKGGVSPASETSETKESTEPKSRGAKFYKKFRAPIHAFIWLLFTGWWIAGLVLHRPGTKNPKNWVVPFLLWLAITVRIVTLWIPISIVYKPLRWTWKNTVSRAVNMIPEKLRTPLGAAGTVAVILVGGFASPTSGDNNRANRGISLLGLALLILGMWATSRNRKAVNWHTIIMGMVSICTDDHMSAKEMRLTVAAGPIHHRIVRPSYGCWLRHLLVYLNSCA